jgi:hypothetical protein
MAVAISMQPASEGTPHTSEAPTVSAVVHHPPVSLVLVAAQIAHEFPHVDCTEWLAMGVDEQIPDFQIDLPAVALLPGAAVVATASAFRSVII